jgi:COP9 signalosome complex subunit 6
VHWGTTQAEIPKTETGQILLANMEVDETPAAVAAPAAAASAAAIAAATPPSLAAEASSASSSSPPRSSVLASSGTVGSVTVSLHPLVIMNISEHWTRTKAQSGSATNDIFGAIIGMQNGRNIEVMNSFELDFGRIDGHVVIDRDYYDLKESQFKQVFSEMDFLGAL